MKTLQSGILLGLLSATAVSIALALQWPTWVVFLSWVSYYVFGKSIKTSLPVLLQILLGIAMGILIQFSAHSLGDFAGAFSLPIIVFLLIGSLSFLTKIKFLNNILAWNLGLIIFFGVHPEVKISSLISLVAPIILGLTFAWINHTVRLFLSIDKSDQQQLKKQFKHSK